MSAQPTIFGLRRSAIFEILFGLATLFLIDMFWGAGERYFDVYPHPYWIIVLLVSVQYGISEGLFAAILCSVVLLFGNMPDQNLHQDIFQYWLFAFTRPLMWVSAAVVLGELSQRHINERNRLREDLDASLEREETISNAYETTRTLKENLEARIAGQLRTAINTYLAARSIERRSAGEVVLGIEELIKSVMNPDKFSVYLLRENNLESIVTHGWASEDTYSSVYTSEDALFQEIVGGQRFLNIINEDDERILEGQGILAGPVIYPETGQVIGMIKIESLGFLALNLSSIEEFKVLCEWIALSYMNALQFEQADADRVINRDTTLLTSGFFQRQSEFLTALAKRSNFDISMIAVRLANSDQLTAEQNKKVAKLVSDAVHSTLRNVDQAFEHQRDDAHFVVVLPNTPLKNAQLVVDKIKKSLSKLPASLKDARFSFTAHTMHKAGQSSSTQQAKRKA